MGEWVGVPASRPVTAGFLRPRFERRGPPVLGRRAAWAVAEQGGRGPLQSQRLRSSNPNQAVDRLLLKWSLASSAPNRVEVSMMRKFCDTGIRKRLAGTGVRFKGTVGPHPPVCSCPGTAGFGKENNPEYWRALVPVPGDSASPRLLWGSVAISRASRVALLRLGSLDAASSSRWPEVGSDTESSASCALPHPRATPRRD